MVRKAAGIPRRSVQSDRRRTSGGGLASARRTPNSHHENSCSAGGKGSPSCLVLGYRINTANLVRLTIPTVVPA